MINAVFAKGKFQCFVVFRVTRIFTARWDYLISQQNCFSLFLLIGKANHEAWINASNAAT